MQLEAAASFGVAEERGGGVVEDEGDSKSEPVMRVLDAGDFVAEVESLGLATRAGRGDGACGGEGRRLGVR